MDQSRRSSLTFGVTLIILGAVFLAVQLVPQLKEWINWENAWPLIIVGIGVAFLIGAVVGGTPGLAVPAAIVGGIGCLLWWQNATDSWESWSYAWALIPGFVGVGIIASGLLSGKLRSALTGGGWLILISLVLFFVFGSFLGGYEQFGAYWPVLLIGLGVLILIRPLFRGRNP
jgi:hypothetical protein